jgi:ribosome-associated translation inhibitor RaiA
LSGRRGGRTGGNVWDEEGFTMRFSDQSYNLRIQLDTHQCRLRPADIDKMQTGLAPLGKQVENFPVSDLHILVEGNARSNDYSVKTSLVLTGETLVSSDHYPDPYTAFERCITNLVENVRAYKDRLGNVPERQKHEKGTHQEAEPTLDPDPAALDAAVREGDYAAFRTAALGYEEPVRRRIGRWVERYPAVNARIGKGLTIDDLVEEVFLNAFESYEKRPKEIRFGDWLEHLIDLSVKTLAGKRDEELENVRMAQSALEAEQGPGTI